ncbi:putative ankyrin repeat protein RF_0381 isoform X2 [Ostrea edulis]|nr:putative ankyrin repeat protein RF_0381 isoform X2 [Ostrea edulis]
MQNRNDKEMSPSAKNGGYITSLQTTDNKKDHHNGDDGSNVLHEACKNAKLEMCKHLIQTYPDLLHSVDNTGWNAALHAARGGNVKILQLLAEHKVDVKHKSNDGWNILHTACVNSNLEMSRYITQEYPDLLHSADNDGWNAALHAARGGNTEILKLLAENKVDLKHKNNNGWNILHVACLTSNLEMSRHVIRTYPDLLHSVENNGWNAALYAAGGGNVEILQLLADNAVDVTHKNNEGWNILHVACGTSNLKMSRYITQQYSDLLHSVDNTGWNAALHAVRGGNFEVLQCLADNEIDVRHKDKNGWNILHVACRTSNLEMSRHVIKTYPDLLHSVSNDHWNAALHAACGGNVRILQLLAGNEIDVKQKCIKGWNILHVACRTSNVEMSRYVIHTYPELLHNVCNVGWNAALHAAEGGNVEILELLAKKEVVVTHRDKSGWNILHVACGTSNLKMSRYITQQYPDLLHSVDNTGWNAALHAARGGNVEILQLLADKEADINHKDNNGWNILHVACETSNFEMSRYIIKTYRYLLHSVDNTGWNAALHAAVRGNVEMLQHLVDNGVDVKHKNNEGWNIIHVACGTSNVKMSRYIIKTFPELLNGASNVGWNAALHAARGGNVEILQLLANNKVDVKHKNNEGCNILHVACRTSNVEMSRYIIKTYPDLLYSVDNTGWNVALYAAGGGNVEILQLLPNNEVDVTHKNNEGWNILHVACGTSNLKMSRYIIQQYPDLLHSVDNTGWNAALHAARGGNVKILQLLAGNEINVRQESNYGWNILHVACLNSNLDMCRYIIQIYPDLLHSVANSDQNTAVFAARGGNVKILQLLDDHGVKISAEN